MSDPEYVPSITTYDVADQFGTIVCPFCGEQDFDRVGLKSHLVRDCETFAATDMPLRPCG